MTAPNVLLVILDSVRARNTSLHGYGDRTTPFLDSFAGEAEWYRQARAPSIHSVASHASLFTGLHVDQHGVTKHESRLAPDATVWSDLAERGYETGLFTPNVVVTESSNLAEPFDTVDGPRRDPKHRYFEDALSPTDVEGHQTNVEYLRRCVASGKPLRSAFNGLYFLSSNKEAYDPEREAGTEYVESFLQWSDERDGPWAACLNFMDAHFPYEPVREFRSAGTEELLDVHDSLSSPISKDVAASEEWWKLRAIEALYDDCIRQADDAVATLVDALRERGVLDDTLLVVTSDHGDGFGEWSRVDPRVRAAYHSWSVHEVLTHVPLLVRRPGGERGGANDSLASLTRFPAVVEAALDGETGSFAVDDRAFASTHRLERPAVMLPDACEDPERYGGPWRAVYEQDDDGVYKYGTHDSASATIRVRDAQVSDRVSDDDGGVVAQSYGELEGADVSDGESESLEDSVEDQLESLGYIR
ncbi:sulfatase-like hydrolase/transferase [Halomicrobium sp. LC1Hm]|uniref:sulfatase-like hydrolase/transferase n=1 Tax=Halomicrobium sp. LC1Hm TaxID=2610902 RepID=UPI00129836FF|nr:sulfatase-like hydrolase/transferase [Halomicrobium sp. LC1Hm]